jgi:tRNA(Arg) A34 adenosine deaminase TadA
MKQALALSAKALDLPGTEPFGAVVVKDGQVVLLSRTGPARGAAAAAASIHQRR